MWQNGSKVPLRQKKKTLCAAWPTYVQPHVTWQDKIVVRDINPKGNDAFWIFFSVAYFHQNLQFETNCHDAFLSSSRLVRKKNVYVSLFSFLMLWMTSCHVPLSRVLQRGEICTTRGRALAWSFFQAHRWRCALIEAPSPQNKFDCWETSPALKPSEKKKKSNEWF